MRVVALLVASYVFLIIACSSRNKVPKGILPQKQMMNVMWDMIRADNFVKDFMLVKDSTLNDTTERLKMYERVFKYNKISREEFARSFKYYREHISLMKELMDSLNTKSQKAPDEIYKERQQPSIDTTLKKRTPLPV